MDQHKSLDHPQHREQDELVGARRARRAAQRGFADDGSQQHLNLGAGEVGHASDPPGLLLGPAEHAAENGGGEARDEGVVGLLSGGGGHPRAGGERVLEAAVAGVVQRELKALAIRLKHVALGDRKSVV